jgi:Fur family ferric uptake transcriptional regulator
VSAERFLAAFEAAGMHQTRPRRLIAERLVDYAARGVDFATDELWREAQQREPRLGRATVYRMVEALVRLGLLDRVNFADGAHRYRVCSERHHHHLTCVQCHQIVELPVCLPASQFSDIAQRTGFAIEGHALEVFGRCPVCRSAPSAGE